MRTKLFGIMAILAVSCVVFAGMASASLVSTSYGFPVIVQNGTTSAFNQDTAFASDYEQMNIDFGIFGDGFNLGSSVGPITTDGLTLGAGASSNVLPFGPVNLAFPSISQTVVQEQDVTHTDFAQTSEYASFAYPFVGVGDVALPGFGFGW
jgi:hypothetical protein